MNTRRRGYSVFGDVVIQTPKRNRSSADGRASWYPYYAGFSSAFATSILASAKLPSRAQVLDPWNGSGTTTEAAAALGYQGLGYDLNPAMVIISKARMLSPRVKTSLLPVAIDILDKASRANLELPIEPDPLCTWLVPRSAAILRALERAIQRLLVDEHQYDLLVDRQDFDALSDLAAFFYTALFRSVRSLLACFYSSNPTWTKRPKTPASRLRPTPETVQSTFETQVRRMIQAIEMESPWHSQRDHRGLVQLATSSSLPLRKRSVDFILSSPPYCTRIDYAVATMTELAVLGYDIEGRFNDLRRLLIGTSTVPKSIDDPNAEWGATCNDFLDQIASHRSKASGSYYFKSHVQYFREIWLSISELRRTLRTGGGCVLVVQDSYYKDIHNNLPKIFMEMAAANGLRLDRRKDFRLAKTMAGINPAVREYRSNSHATESVLCFTTA